MKKKILVTGGAGYIGSHTVVDLYNNGYQPIILDNLCNSEAFIIDRINTICNAKIPFYELDCNLPETYKLISEKEGSIAGVIHFAAHKAVGESVENPIKYYKNNVGSLMTLLDNLDTIDSSKVVFSSSCTVYGQPKELPVTEESPILKSLSPYGATKQICETILEDFTKVKNVQSVILRYFNPIGTHESHLIGELPIGVPDNLIPYITQTGIGKRKTLTVFGKDYKTSDGTCIRDYIHVTDLANAHIKALEYMFDNQEKSIDYFNVGTGQGNTVLEIINAFNKASNTKLSYTFGDRRSGDIEKIWAKTEKAEQILKWKAKKGIEEALFDAWKWEQNLK